MGTRASGCNLAAVLAAIDRLRSAEGVDDFEVDEGPAGRRGGASFSTASMRKRRCNALVGCVDSCAGLNHLELVVAAVLSGRSNH